MGWSVSSDGGIVVEGGRLRYVLDPKGPVSEGYAFVSHAHIDHMHSPSAGEKVIASKATKDLAMARGYDLGEVQEVAEGVKLLDSGHILGARAVLIGDDVFYTGDASGRERGFLKRCETRRARILVMETTYGTPGYVFPETSKLVKEVNSFISGCYDKGKPVVLMGYPLGKAQLLSYFFSCWEPLFYHRSVAEMNRVHVEHGVSLKGGGVFDPSAGVESLPQGPWLMVAPMSGPRSTLAASLKKSRGAVLVAFSGWATRPGYRLVAGADASFPLSDHCDYQELVRLAKEVSPEKVYTVHGFAAEFASDLRRLGFDATPLGPYQSTLGDFREAAPPPNI